MSRRSGNSPDYLLEFAERIRPAPRPARQTVLEHVQRLVEIYHTAVDVNDLETALECLTEIHALRP